VTGQTDVVRLRALVALKVFDPSAGGEIVAGFEFDPSTPPVVTLGGLSAGTIFSQASVLVIDPFDDPAATLSLGIPTDLGLLLAPEGCRLGSTGTYTSEALVVVDAPAMLLLTLTLGTSTQGRGYIFFRRLP
jgi:hypothetical protein